QPLAELAGFNRTPCGDQFRDFGSEGKQANRVVLKRQFRARKAQMRSNCDTSPRQNLKNAIGGPVLYPFLIRALVDHFAATARALPSRGRRTVTPFRYDTRTAGTFTEPSGCW